MADDFKLSSISYLESISLNGTSFHAVKGKQKEIPFVKGRVQLNNCFLTEVMCILTEEKHKLPCLPDCSSFANSTVLLPDFIAQVLK